MMDALHVSNRACNFLLIAAARGEPKQERERVCVCGGKREGRVFSKSVAVI